MLQHEWFMKMAIDEAYKASSLGEVPVGALVVDSQGHVLSQAYNLRESSANPCGHAEILALEGAGEKTQNWRLQGATLYVSLEPCLMCMGAMVNARIKQLVFGAYDLKGGALSLGAYSYLKKTNHQFAITGGVMHYENSRLMSKFFRERRGLIKN